MGGTEGASLPRFAVLDSWRGIAACMVALFHLRVLSHVGEATLVRNASLFVDFFFVLSGFLITGSYAARLAASFGAWRFALLRFGRLYPLHLAVLAAFVWLGGAPVGTPEGSLGFAAHLFLLHGLGVIATPVWGNVPSWSISTEFFVYLIFSAAVALRAWTPRLLGLTVVVLPAAIYAGAGNLAEADGYQLLRGVYGFAAGSLAWTLFRRLGPRRAPGTPAELAAIAALLLFVAGAGGGALSVLAPFVFAAVVLVFAFEAGAASRLLACRPLVWIGTVSYSIYMVHYFVAARMVDVVAAAQSLGVPLRGYLGVERWAGDLAMLLYLAAVIALGGLSYRLIEAPSRAWFRQLAAHAAPRRAAA
jgi:peptidoglycan/LPS O-acetylase OafA/YrhL